MSNPKIAIIGAGLSGLTLARVLQVHGIKSSVFERDTSRVSRSQGGSLDLHPPSGQYALKTAGLYEDFRAVMRKEGQDYRLLDRHAKTVIEKIASDEDEWGPEIDRGELRDIFLRNLEDVKWGQHVESIVRGPKGFELTFLDGHRETFDLVIGADGTWSRVRPLLSSSIPVYCGVYFIELYLEDADARHPEASKLVGNGSMIALGDSKGLMAQRNGDGKIRVYVVPTVPERWAKESGIDWSNPQITKERLLEFFPDWNTELLDLIRQCDRFVMPRPIYALPPGHSWTHQEGLTIIGDAAHVMSPFAGEGANMAMWDAAELALAIVKGLSGGNLDEEIAKSEKAMFKRAGAAAEDSAAGLRVCIAPDAPNLTSFVALSKAREEASAATSDK